MKKPFLHFEKQTETLQTGEKYVSQVLCEAIVVYLETTFYSVNNGTKISLNWSGKVKNIVL